MTDPQRCFLVTCLGAYDDSGVGTGGFVCVHEGQALILDKIDSTGLCEHEDRTIASPAVCARLQATTQAGYGIF
jgi:hypothetical protein